MSNQPDIGWCPCCKRAVIEIPAGSCSDCFNHTMTLMSVYDHEAELSATKEKMEVTEKAHELMMNTCMQWKIRAEAAEKRIRESREQEPVGSTGEVFAYSGDDESTYHYVKATLNPGVKAGEKLYTIPPIQPELAELKLENSELRKQLESLNDLHH